MDFSVAVLLELLDTRHAGGFLGDGLTLGADVVGAVGSLKLINKLLLPTDSSLCHHLSRVHQTLTPNSHNMIIRLRLCRLQQRIDVLLVTVEGWMDPLSIQNRGSFCPRAQKPENEDDFELEVEGEPEGE